VMAGYELADSSLVAQILYHVTRRRYRGFTVTVIALILLSAVWICSDLAVDSFRHLPFDIFRTQDSTSDHQTQRISDQKTSGSKWETQNPTADAGSLIPPKIWQILLPKKQLVDNLVIDPGTLQDTASWLAMNTDYT
jgi:alpha 1,6-mannosyltransferase